ncbi:MAG TPA: hypothetical protein VFJ87_10450 [Rhodanobacteraceae bacterium]|jgi:hypothetical protein|nr:hypothetical protein [Rhodanobacteraceae bacterium]
MRPVLRRAVLATACLSALVLAGCGKHVDSNAPITFAPADTPYLFANLQPVPTELTNAWADAFNAGAQANAAQFGQLAKLVGDEHPDVAKILTAMQAELATAHTRKEVATAMGFPMTGLFAMYGIGDVPVMRTELASPDTFKAFWAKVQQRAGVSIPTASVGNQAYWLIGGNDAKVHVLVAVEGKQLVATLAPADASPDMLEQLLGLKKPTSNAAARLEKINSEHGYSDYGSGYIDLPKLFANAFDGKDAVTQEFAKDFGAAPTNPACATEFASLASNVPMASLGMTTYTPQEMRQSVDIKLSPSLLGALSALKQPVAGMDAKSDDSMFDMVLALPLQKWQAFIQDRAKVAAEKAYQCPALQSLNKFAQTAANPPVQMPPEAASLLGVRLVLDKWEPGPQFAGRVLVASSNPAELAQKVQQTAPQFALKTISTDGKPVAFDLPPRMQVMLGGGNQGWIAADSHSLAAGVGAGEDSMLANALNAPAGNGDTMLRMHVDGKMYGVLASWFGRFAAMAPAKNQADMQNVVTLFNRMSETIKAIDMRVTLDHDGLHFEGDTQHR